MIDMRDQQAATMDREATVEQIEQSQRIRTAGDCEQADRPLLGQRHEAFGDLGHEGHFGSYGSMWTST
ncbi:MAG: hypothetical protein V9E87_13450 [Gemmatimonadales bacterium]